jgi:hypothetical protein
MGLAGAFGGGGSSACDPSRYVGLGVRASVEDVATILGNTPQVVARHYAPWVKARQEQLEAAVRKTW